VVKSLLTAGAAVNALDSVGDTPLYLAVFRRPIFSLTTDDWKKTIELLLSHGAHVDMANADGEVVYDKLPPDVTVFNHVSLACSAARAVRRYQLPYRGTTPATLADFVDVL